MTTHTLKNICSLNQKPLVIGQIACIVDVKELWDREGCTHIHRDICTETMQTHPGMKCQLAVSRRI